ncbi:MAG TPA: IPT/TIG domain-containing protein, partial [Bryobacteraceae bacterium]|nr:IPT/TIG domain-containing protein [Bryobacteraceae bacterium]
LDSSGNLYIADAANNRIRKVSGGKISTYAGNGTAQYSGDGGAATSASLADPYGLAFDQQGNLYISDLNNQVIRQVTPGGTISTFAGINLYGSGGDGGPATSAYLNRPIGLAVDTAGDLYIADSNNYCIRKITTDGIIHTVAGKITASGYSGDGGPATSALMGAPFGIALDAAGNLYIADTSNNRIRMVSAATGIITTVAGNGQQGDGGDGGQATSAQLNDPEGVAVDAAGAIYISEKFGNRVRQVVNGVINTVQGSPLFEPFGLLAGPSGALYIADFGNDVIRLLTPNAPSVAGIVSASAFGAFTSAAPGSWIEIYGTNLAFSRRFWGAADFSGSNAPTSLDGTSVTIGGQPAAVYYISGGQVNAQVPTGVSPGSQAITVKNAAGTSSSVSVNLAATEPGLLTQFKVNSVQYVSALFSDNTTYAMPANAVSGLPSRPAKAGDVITMYGIGFGPVTPAVSSGQIAPASSCSPSCLNSQVQISIGGTPATLQYAGLAPGEVGVYQFNVVVPAVAAGNSVPVTFSLGGQAGTQTLYTAVQ